MLKALFEGHLTLRAHRGWPRALASAGTWRGIRDALREGKLDLLGEWGDVGAVHCALYEPATRGVQIATLDASAGRVPSLAVFHPPASRLERSIVDPFGIGMVRLPDARAW